MQSPSDIRRKMLQSLKQRIDRQLHALAVVRTELAEINRDQFMRPIAADDHPWILGIGKSAKELREMHARVEQLLE